MCYLQKPIFKEISIDPALESIYNNNNILSPETVLSELEILLEISNIEFNYSEDFDVSLDDDLILD